MAKEFLERRISEMYVSCSYPVAPIVLAASDTCQAHATSGVVLENGSTMFRCACHEGLIEGKTRGRVVYAV